MWARRRSFAVLAALTALTAASSAEASDARPRATVIWPEDGACATVVDRSQNPVVHFEYAASMEDLVLDPGEIETGRRFQFFVLSDGFDDNIATGEAAFCRRGAEQTEHVGHVL